MGLEPRPREAQARNYLSRPAKGLALLALHLIEGAELQRPKQASTAMSIARPVRSAPLPPKGSDKRSSVLSDKRSSVVLDRNYEALKQLARKGELPLSTWLWVWCIFIKQGRHVCDWSSE